MTPKLARDIAGQLDIHFDDYPFEEFYKGIDIEREHNKTLNPDFPDERSLRDWIMYARISRDHLVERPDYYTKLVKMEAEPKEKTDKKILKVNDKEMSMK